jgi:hypothetical protein
MERMRTDSKKTKGDPDALDNNDRANHLNDLRRSYLRVMPEEYAEGDPE